MSMREHSLIKLSHLVVVLIFLAATPALQAQGTANFNNRVKSGATYIVDAPISFAGSGPAPAGPIDGGAGNNYGGYVWGGLNARAALYGGPAGSTEAQLVLLAPEVNFRSGTKAGYVEVGTEGAREIASVAPFQPAVVQIRVWDCGFSGVSSYEDAASLAAQQPAYLGKSALINLASTGGSSPPTPAANLIGLQAFSISFTGTNVGPPGVWNALQTQAVAKGGNVCLAPLITGALPLQLQWWFNGAPLPGQTNLTLCLTNFQAANAGSYFVVITNAFGSAVGSPTFLEITRGYALSAVAQGGGTVVANPGALAFLAGSSVTLTATTNTGWTFLGWTGDASGAAPQVTLTMDQNRCVEAVFGTGLQTAVPGGGYLHLEPLVQWYPYGTSVRVTAIPSNSQSFSAWGNSAGGTNNPITFVVTNANPTISCLFAPLTGNQSALTVIPQGGGLVAMTPQKNAYSNGQSVLLQAMPDAGQNFLGWSGDASGTQTNLSVTVSASKVITALFSQKPRLSAPACWGAYSTNAFQFSFTGLLGNRYTVYQSSNLVNWVPLNNVTNLYNVLNISLPRTLQDAPRFYRVQME